MIGVVTASASTGLSPEWDRWFDEAFTDLITGDEELLRAEFDDLIASSWQSPPPPPASPPSSSGGESAAENSRDDLPGNAAQPEPDPGRASRPPP
jgi:hypothetical protein